MEKLQRTLQRLGNGGWGPIFDRLNIDPNSTTLRDDLLAPVNLSPFELALIPGFGDIAPTARRAIEPGDPARSILFHALASAGMTTTPDGTALTTFPTPADLDEAENVVFGILPPTLDSILANLGNNAIVAAVVFARDYRQASKTVHGRHADMVFSRTGIVRVGNLAPTWDGRVRAYSPREEADDPFDFRAMPCRYGVYLAVQMEGDAGSFGPFKFNRGFELGRQAVEAPDSDLDFWVPVHKLFSGMSCLLGKTLDVSLEPHHVNEKIRRIHNENMGVPVFGGFDSGFKPPTTNTAPFIQSSDLAAFLPEGDHGAGTLAPTIRSRFIEPTVVNGTWVGTRVPSRPGNGLAPSFNIPASGRAHPAPEWMHVRTQLRSNGSDDNLNTKRDVAQIVRDARVGNTDNYVAAHYSDFTGDGWIDARILGLSGELSRMVPAYSVISAPDFYPFVDQSALVDWWRNQVPTIFRNNIWAVPPLTLADQRTAANINLRDFGADIRAENKTPTAIVGLRGSAQTSNALGAAIEMPRVSSLPDAGAGIFAPGWDVSTDVSFDANVADDVLHLAAYGLGSPFPEDAKLCAALSAFWPGVAPDTARSAGRRIVAPMTDREVGLETAPAWDGVPGPRRVTIGTEDFVETDNFDHVDYVTSALAGRFTMAETMKVSQEDYQTRVLFTARMYRFIGDLFDIGRDLTPVHNAFRMLSFIHGRANDALIANAESVLGFQFDDKACRYEMALISTTNPIVQDASNPARWLRREKILGTLHVIVGAQNRLVFRINNGEWLVPAGTPVA